MPHRDCEGVGYAVTAGGFISEYNEQGWKIFGNIDPSPRDVVPHRDCEVVGGAATAGESGKKEHVEVVHEPI